MKSPPERLAALRSLATVIEERRHDLERMIVKTSKKTWQVAVDDVALALRRLRSFDQLVPLLTGREPVGTVATVFPSNASLSNPVSTIGAAFLAGNAVRCRFPAASRAWAGHVEPVITDCLPGVDFDYRDGPTFLINALRDADVEVVMVFGDDSWAAPYESSVRASRTKFIFEGPGKDPFLVLSDADPLWAAREAVRGAYYNAGQACTSPERFYVQQDGVWEAFVSRVVELTQEQVVGDPERPDVTIGPIVSERVVARIVAQLRDACEQGARVLVGGRVESARLRDGTRVTFVQPTVLVGIHSGMTIMQEETFGPIVPIQRVQGADEALALASESPYGLAASVFGGGPEALQALASTHGMVFHNELWLDYFQRCVHAPYGGRKRSGWVWAWEQGEFVRRDGPRNHILEFTRPIASRSEGGHATDAR